MNKPRVDGRIRSIRSKDRQKLLEDCLFQTLASEEAELISKFKEGELSKATNSTIG